jgi:hypothetical protein
VSALVSPLVPPVVLPPRADRGTRPSRSGRPLPLPTLIGRRTRGTVYGLAGVDDRGRIADRSIIRALRWTGSTRLTMRVDAGLVVVAAMADGQYGLAGRDRVPLPAAVRYAVGIEPGDRVLLAAEPADELLVVHSPACLDAMLSALPGRAGGDAA